MRRRRRSIIKTSSPSMLKAFLPPSHFPPLHPGPAPSSTLGRVGAAEFLPQRGRGFTPAELFFLPGIAA